MGASSLLTISELGEQYSRTRKRYIYTRLYMHHLALAFLSFACKWGSIRNVPTIRADQWYDFCKVRRAINRAFTMCRSSRESSDLLVSFGVAECDSIGPDTRPE